LWLYYTPLGFALLHLVSDPPGLARFALFFVLSFVVTPLYTRENRTFAPRFRKHNFLIYIHLALAIVDGLEYNWYIGY